MTCKKIGMPHISLSPDSPDFPTDLEPITVGPLPIVASFCRKLGIPALVDKHVVSPENISSGEVVMAMIMDTLTGRNPLYKVSETFQHQDIGLLFGREIELRHFNDNNLGKVLDNIHASGSSQLFSKIAWQACQTYNLDLKFQHFDTTSVNVHGDYAGYGQETEDHIAIIHGHSKDNRPDLKQFLFSCLCVEGSIPLLGAVHSGNKSDKKANNQELSKVASLMKKHKLDPKAHIYIADSAAVTKDNLVELNAGLFVTRLPATYGAERQVIEQALEDGLWKDVGVLKEMPVSQTGKATTSATARPPAHYRICDIEVTLYDTNYRAVVVHSSAHDKRRLKKLERKLEADRTLFKELEKSEKKTFYACRKDAENAAARLLAKNAPSFHQIEFEILESPLYQPGRPRAGQPRSVRQMRFQIVLTLREDDARIRHARECAGCFVLLTNIPVEGKESLDSREILVAYKQQYGVEMNFRFLKDPLIVNDTFLKNAERIEALGFILLLSLMVWNLIQLCLRRHLDTHQGDLPGWDNKRTTRPTTFMVLFFFRQIAILRWHNKTRRRCARPFQEHHREYLFALGLSENIFTHPMAIGK